LSLASASIRTRSTYVCYRDPELTLQRSERFLGVFAGSLVHPLESPLNPHDRGRVRRQVQQLLVGFGVLDDEFGLSVHREHLRTPGCAETFHVLSRVALEVRE
jgi:hypothetical protein